MQWPWCRVYALQTFLSRAQSSAPLRLSSPVLSCCFSCPSSQQSGYTVLTLSVTPFVQGKGRRSQDGKQLPRLLKAQTGVFVGKARLKLRRGPNLHKRGHGHHKNRLEKVEPE